MKRNMRKFEMNLSTISVEKQEVIRERYEKYRIFKETMREYYPKLKEEIIKKMFVAKFGDII